MVNIGSLRNEMNNKTKQKKISTSKDCRFDSSCDSSASVRIVSRAWSLWPKSAQIFTTFTSVSILTFLDPTLVSTFCHRMFKSLLFIFVILSKLRAFCSSPLALRREERWNFIVASNLLSPLVCA